MVVCYHIGVSQDPDNLDVIASFFSDYGLFGVDIFFPLSGYLITGFLINRYERYDILVFFIRRFFRIVPLYMAALLIFLTASMIFHVNLDALHNLWKNALFLTGWAVFHEGRDVVPYTITWSVSVEEFAYILFGLGAFLLRGRLGVFLSTMILFAIALRFAINMAGIADVYYYPPARLDSIALGGLTALATYRGWPVIAPLLLLFFVTSIAMQFGRIPYHSLVYLQIAAGTCFFIHVFATFMPRVDLPILNTVASIGFYSYFIYLFHYFNIYVFENAQRLLDIQLAYWLSVSLVLFLTYTQAWFSYRFYEGPLMAVGRRLEQKINHRITPSTKSEIT